ncbi:Uncharacterised protein [Candidatus Gugararchaeum adminiculabundum]|nr:Uncharacterised protein [Candidatus Gugararchaeum adminiculabundum]
MPVQSEEEKAKTLQANVDAFQKLAKKLHHTPSYTEWKEFVGEKNKKKKTLLKAPGALMSSYGMDTWNQFVEDECHLPARPQGISHKVRAKEPLSKARVREIKDANIQEYQKWVNEERGSGTTTDWDKHIAEHEEIPDLLNSKALAKLFKSWAVFREECGFDSKIGHRSILADLSPEETDRLKKVNKEGFLDFVDFCLNPPSLNQVRIPNRGAWNQYKNRQKKTNPDLLSIAPLLELFGVKEWDALFDLFDLQRPEKRSRPASSIHNSRNLPEEEKSDFVFPKKSVDRRAAELRLLELRDEIQDGVRHNQASTGNKNSKAKPAATKQKISFTGMG